MRLAELRGHATNLVLVVLGAILAVYMLAFDRTRLTTGETESRQRHVLPAWRSGELAEIEIQRGSESTRLSAAGPETEPRTWVLEQGGERVEADERAVGELLSTLELAVFERRAADEGRAGYGLAAPRLVLSVRMGELGYTLRLGGPAPSPAGGAYLELEVQPGRGGARPAPGVMVVSKALCEALLAWPDRLRSRRLVPYAASRIASLEAKGERSWRIERAGPAAFMLGAPGRAAKVRAGRREIDALFAALGRIEAERFVPVPARALAARLTLGIGLGEPAPGAVELQLGASCPGGPGLLLLRRRTPEVAACVAEQAVRPLWVGADELADRFLVAARPDEIYEIKLSSPARSIELARRDAGWHMRPPAAVHVRRIEDGAVLRLDEGLARGLEPAGVTLRAAAVFNVPPKDVRALRIVTQQGRQKLSRTEDGGWSLDEPAGAGLRPDAGLVAAFAQALGRLEALRWVADADDGSFGLGEPWCRIEADVETGDAEPARTLGLELGGEVPGGYYARRQGDPAVFVAPRGLGAMAERWLLDRGALLVDLAAVDTVSVTTGRRELQVVAGQESWRAEGAGAGAEALGRQVQEALRDLVAEGVARLGAPARAEGFARPRLVVRVDFVKDAAPGRVVLRVGAGEVWRDTSVFYVRRDGVEATFAVAQSRLRPLLELL
ncbi:MAG: DUF4340 domain-containing protein [Deltaproteobacteria bacterium]|nr:DUF4340 domain-containing protein [Deltaproteobacteria bacterium]